MLQWYVVHMCGVVTVEKVTVVARLLSVESIENNQQIKTSLAHAFCYLIGSLQDINLYVVERATLYLETIKASSIKVSSLDIVRRVHACYSDSCKLLWVIVYTIRRVAHYKYYC